jgi:preprotein translocase subunit YajC
MILANFMGFMQGQAASGARPQGNFITALIPFILVFVVFYVLIILPSRKKQKKHQDMVDALKSGDKVVTTGGIYGTVMGVQQDRIELKVSANVKIDVTKNAIGVILGAKTDEKQK